MYNALYTEKQSQELRFFHVRNSLSRVCVFAISVFETYFSLTKTP